MYLLKDKETGARAFQHSRRSTSTETVWPSLYLGDMWRCIWFRHCATNRKIADSIPEGDKDIFYWLNLSGRTVALGSTQPIAEMSTIGNLWGGRGVKAAGVHGWQPRHLHDCLGILGASTSWSSNSLSGRVKWWLECVFGNYGLFSSW